ncbi:hypothetical protein KC685_04780 [Candidatus Dojkabacteria bacterium]|uniref:Uncharacterized protein n=1 Tax=Candidatus Dojkabacteria bacterium TaxID=2099670 RepID=A0A955I9X7_9BACT|nr:hypothetical protein [Candidatus Dojkabacteria bacterium]
MKTLLSKLKTVNRYKALTVLLFLIVVTVQLILAINTPLGVSPDEPHHYNSIKYYSGESLDPFITEQNSYYDLGDMTRVGSYLYPYTLSLILRVGSFISDEYLLLRLTNVFISIINFSIFYATAQLFLRRDRSVLIAMSIAYSFLMYIFIGAFINYDNLAITFSLIMSYGYLRYLKKKDLHSILIIISASLFGAVTKYTLLPLSALIVLMLLLDRKFWSFLRSPRQLIRRLLSEKIFLGLILAGSILFLERYVLNLVVYHSIQPDCDLIHLKEKCMENAVFARNSKIYGLGIQGEKISFIKYVYLWLNQMYDGAMGIFGHHILPDWSHSSKFIGITLISSFVGFLKLLKERSWSKLHLGLIIIPLGYMAIMIFTVHYPNYLSTGSISLAVQGRYLFPVWSIGVIGVTYYLTRFERKWIELFFLVIFGLLLTFNLIHLHNNIELLWWI